MKIYNTLSKTFTDEVKTQIGVGKSIDEAFEDVKSAIIDNNFGEPTPTPKPDSNIPTPSEPTPTPKPIDVNELTHGDGQQDGFYYVDLGLSVKWATCNVGADSASDEGKLFQFGRVDGYKYGDSSNQFRTNDQNTQDTGSSYIPLTTSGNTYDKGETLQSADDAANVNMGGAWKMPTKDELEELFNNTTHEVKTISNTSGMLFTSTRNGKSLFIPFAGNWSGNFYNNGSDASVWSSQVLPSYVNFAYRLSCYSSGNALPLATASRSSALSVRGVFKPQE